MRVIAIYNGKTNTRYRYSKAGWFSWRSVEPSKVRKKFRRGLPNLIEIPGRVVVDLERGTYTSVPEDDPNVGLRAVSTSGEAGDLFVMAPDLNFFTVVNQSGKTGRRQVHGNIQIGEQPVHLFEPPAGVQVRVDPQPHQVKNK